MVNPIDDYLARLKGRLAKRLPATVVQEHLNEISNHLNENVRSRVAAGEEESVASFSALKDMGSDYLVADSLIRAHSGVAKKSVWRLGWPPSLLLVVAGTLPISFVFGFNNNLVEEIALWLPWSFVVWYAVACFRTRRIVLQPVLAALALVLVLCFAQAWVYGPYGSLPSVSARRQEVIRQSTAQVQLLSAELKMVQANDKTPFPPVLHGGNTYFSPEPFSATNFGRSIVNPIGGPEAYLDVRLASGDSEEQARSKWRHLEPTFVSQIRMNLKNVQANLATWQEVNPSFTTIAEDLKRFLEMFVPAAAVIAAINLLALLAAEIRRRIVMAAWSRKRWA